MLQCTGDGFVAAPARKRAHRPHTRTPEIRIYWKFERGLLIEVSVVSGLRRMSRPRSGDPISQVFVYTRISNVEAFNSQKTPQES